MKKKIKKSFRCRLKPDASQENSFAQFAGARRFIYNHGLARSIKDYEQTGKRPSRYDLMNELPLLKLSPETAWLAEMPAQILQQSFQDLDLSFENAFRRLDNNEEPGFPTFRKKGVNDSFRYPQHVKIDGDETWFPKIGWVRFYNSRPIEGVIKQTTIKREGKHWYVTFVCEVEIDIPTITYDEARSVGIDVGIKLFATLSTGEQIENLRFLEKALKQLAHAQHDLARKKKGSKNWEKQKAKIAQIHIFIKNCRKDFLQKLSTRIVKNHDAIVVETLNIAGMVRNHNLARAILDAAWRQFITMLKYKAEWAGKWFIEIPRFTPTSKQCSQCGSKQGMPLSVRTYECKICGMVMDRDLNASINIRTAGHAVLACGGMSPSSP